MSADKADKADEGVGDSGPTLRHAPLPPLRPPPKFSSGSPPGSEVDLATIPRDRLAPMVSELKHMLEGTAPIPRRSGSARRLIAWWPPSSRSIVVGAVLVVALVTTFVREWRISRRAPQARPSITTPASATIAPVVIPAAPAAAVPTPAACTVAGASRVIAPSALVAAGIEVRAFGDEIALGFARSEHQAMLARVDPSSAMARDTTLVSSLEPIHRALPIPGKRGQLSLAIDVDRKGDAIQGRRTLPLDPPLQVGAQAGAAAGAQLVWAELGRNRVGGKLWPLEGDGRVESLRGARSESDLASVALVFRRAGAVWVATADAQGSLQPKGNLWRLEPGGPNIGSPALAYNNGVIVVAWADRASSQEPWQLQWVEFKAGEAPGAAKTFVPPGGGKGDQAMSPALAVIPGGGFLLVWTEGPPSAHGVRALTLTEEGAALGPPLAISGSDVNAGQGQAAIAAGGHGVVGFFESAGGGFQVVATPIACVR